MSCKNCRDGCYAKRHCEGCNEDLCELCYKEHNAIHFDGPIRGEHDCQCDDCFVSAEAMEENS